MFKKSKKRFSFFRRRSKLEKFYDKNKEFIRYCLISFICTIILYVVFFIVDLITKGNYLIANFFSYTISFTALFFMNRKAFDAKPVRKRDKAKQLTSFVIVRIIGFPLDSLVLSILINNFSMGNMVAKIVGSLIMFIYNYITNKLFVFNKDRFLWSNWL